MEKVKKKLTYALFAIGLLAIVSPASAFQTRTLDNVKVEGDFIVGPGKMELFLSPGESTTRELTVTNRTGKALNVILDLEDFTGDNTGAAKLLGEERGPFTLKNYIKPEKPEFKLAHGEQVKMDINVDIPSNAEPGGLYGAVIVRAVPWLDAKDSTTGSEVKGQVSVTSRLATLVFVRVKGDVKEEGRLKSFTSDKKFYSSAPVNLNLNYENNGKVHLNAYGTIEISNLAGKKIDNIDIPPFFVMPGFSRIVPFAWDKELAFGRYTARLQLNRGYQDIVDEMSVNFWIIPMRVLITGVSIVLLLSLFIWWFSSKFELKRKN